MTMRQRKRRSVHNRFNRLHYQIRLHIKSDANLIPKLFRKMVPAKEQP